VADRSAVTVLGLGSMRAAQAKALLRRDFKITVWNRSSERAAPLVATGRGAKQNRQSWEAKVSIGRGTVKNGGVTLNYGVGLHH
jgi:3-hydroxyisobutyrate dehydrogenase-like beta-hydroxyacid dehydrogenase